MLAAHVKYIIGINLYIFAEPKSVFPLFSGDGTTLRVHVFHTQESPCVLL